MSDITYRNAKQIFLNYCKTKGLSPKTLRWYDLALERIIRYLEREHPELTPGTTTIEPLRAFVAMMVDKKAAPNTVNHTITAIKTLFKFLHEDKYIETNEAYRLEKVRVPKFLIQPFSPEQVKALLAQPNHRRFAGIRDYTVLLLLLDTGLRISEALALTPSDINWNASTVKVMGKGSKERVVPFGRSVRLALDRYLERRGDLPKNAALFVSEYGTPLPVRVFQENMARYGRGAGIKGVRISPHTCRHTFAVNWIRSGGDVFHLQRILGHSSLDICRTYVNLVTDDLQKAHVTHSPIDRMLSSEQPVQPQRVRIK